MNDHSWASALSVYSLTAMIDRDHDKAPGCHATIGIEIISPGGRTFTGIVEIALNNAGRYRFFRKTHHGHNASESGGSMRFMITDTL